MPSIIRQHGRHIFSNPELSFSVFYRTGRVAIVQRREQRERLAKGEAAGRLLGMHDALSTQIHGAVPDLVTEATSPASSRSPEPVLQRTQSLSSIESRLGQPRSNFPILESQFQATVSDNNPSRAIYAPVPRNLSFAGFSLDERRGRGIPHLLQTNIIAPTPLSTCSNTSLAYSTGEQSPLRPYEMPTQPIEGAEIATLAACRAGSLDHVDAATDSSGTLSPSPSARYGDTNERPSHALQQGPRARHHAGQRCPGCPGSWLPADAPLFHLGAHIADDHDSNDLEEGDRSIAASRASRLSGGRIPGIGRNWMPSERNAVFDLTSLTPTAQVRPLRRIVDIDEGQALSSSNTAPLPDPRTFDLTDDNVDNPDTAVLGATENGYSELVSRLERVLSLGRQSRRTLRHDGPTTRSPLPGPPPERSAQHYNLDDPSQWRFMEGASRNQSWTEFWPGELHRTEAVNYGTYLQDQALQRELEEAIMRVPGPGQRRPDIINEDDIDSEHEASGPLPGPTPLPAVRLPSAQCESAPIAQPVLGPGDLPVRSRLPTPMPLTPPDPSTSGDESEGLVLDLSTRHSGRTRDQNNLILGAARNRIPTREVDRGDAAAEASSCIPQVDGASFSASTDPSPALVGTADQNTIIAELAARTGPTNVPQPQATYRSVLLLVRRYSALGESDAENAIDGYEHAIMQRDWSVSFEPIDYLRHPFRRVPIESLCNGLHIALWSIQESRIERGLSVLRDREYDVPNGFPERANASFYRTGEWDHGVSRRRSRSDPDLNANSCMPIQARQAVRNCFHRSMMWMRPDVLSDRFHFHGLDTAISWHNSGWFNSDVQLDARPGEYEWRLTWNSFRRRFGLRPLYGAGE